jgi:hypothetical protein
MAAEPNLAAPEKEFNNSVTPSDMSFVDEKEKATQDSDDDNNVNNNVDNHDELPKQDLERVESSMYPTSFKLASILIAIMLSMLLVALDMVSPSPKAAWCANHSH